MSVIDDDSTGQSYSHIPVLLDRCLELLDPALTGVPDPVLVDATVGLGGHTQAFLDRHPTLRVVGLDRDRQALALTRARLAAYGERVTLVHTVYDRIGEVLDQLGITRVQGILFDLGVSSLQLDSDERGFAYSRDTQLDMRMDPDAGGVTAEQVLNTYSVGQLTMVLQRYGEERFARRIASVLVRERQRQRLTSTAQVADLVRQAIPAATRRTGGHPAKRTFQALRIEVNAELAALEAALPAAIAALAVGGRIVVLTYHSAEDRIVKRVLSAGAASLLPPGVPVREVDDDRARPELMVLARGEAPSAEEQTCNTRASSARVRAAQRLKEAA